MSEELKACPFCGEVASVGRLDTGWIVECGNDACHVSPWVSATHKFAAIAAWNTRPSVSEEKIEEMAMEIVNDVLTAYVYGKDEMRRAVVRDLRKHIGEVK